MFGKKPDAQKPIDEGAEVLTVTRLDDGQQVAHLPVPAKLLISPQILGLAAGEIVETLITFRFANIHARYRVVGVNTSGVLVADLIQQSENRLPPPITPDLATMGRRG